MKQIMADMNMNEVTIAYGMTGTSPVSFQSHTDDPLEKRVSAGGRVHPGVEVKVVDKSREGNPVILLMSCVRADILWWSVVRVMKNKPQNPSTVRPRSLT